MNISSFLVEGIQVSVNAKMSMPRSMAVSLIRSILFLTYCAFGKAMPRPEELIYICLFLQALHPLIVTGGVLSGCVGSLCLPNSSNPMSFVDCPENI